MTSQGRRGNGYVWRERSEVMPEWVAKCGTCDRVKDGFRSHGDAFAYAFKHTGSHGTVGFRGQGKPHGVK